VREFGHGGIVFFKLAVVSPVIETDVARGHLQAAAAAAIGVEKGAVLT
jgi:hypothetical protein